MAKWQFVPNKHDNLYFFFNFLNILFKKLEESILNYLHLSDKK